MSELTATTIAPETTGGTDTRVVGYSKITPGPSVHSDLSLRTSTFIIVLLLSGKPFPHIKVKG
nr:MAG TPA: hypothetical protein [Caudoviricetes sp.]